MNHQVQTSLLVDNEWVSRPVDAYQFMAQARQSDGHLPEPIAKSTNHVPELGVLSRTIFASPLFKSVRPANIRHKHNNDVVLIGEDAVQLKEIHDYGRLRHVATKSDFKGRILAARVFGDPREIPAQISSPLPKNHSVHRVRRSMTGDEGPVLPPEVIVLTLTSRTLMFLWARHAQNGAVTFSHKTVRLPAGVSRFDRFGAFLAIDPKRRAIAVAAQEGRFILYKTKSMERWRKELRGQYQTTPIEDERIIPLEGRVMHMEFLSSGSAQDEFHVVLLFVLVLQGKTKITCFDWDCREDLSAATVRTERVAVDFHDHNPSLLIPLSRTSDFLLVLDTHIAIYKDVLSGAPRRSVAPIDPAVLPSLLPGDSKYRPRWVEWDKTPRNPDYPKDAFYIAREDGRILYVERGPSGTVDTVDAGHWPYRIDTAFACLSVDNSEFSQSYPDVLIAGGAGNDGRLCKLGSWPAEYSYAASYPCTNQLSYVDSIPNWTPITDLYVTRFSGVPTLHERDRYSILVANGSNPHGEISDLRHGLQSVVDHSFNGMNGSTGLWVIDYGSQTIEFDGKPARQQYATFAITTPPETLIIRVVRAQREVHGEFSGAWEDGTWNVEQITGDEESSKDGVMRDEETISACPWTERFAVQITRDEVRVLHRPSLQQCDAIPRTSSILLGACKSRFPFVAIAFRESISTYLETLAISQDGHLTSTSTSKVALDHDPTCIELFDVRGAMYVFVSTLGSTIYLLKVDDAGNIHHGLQNSLESAAIDNTRVVLESAVLLSAGEGHMLVCATRSGYLISSRLPSLEQSDPCFSWSVVRMGTTSAQIMPSATDSSAAFVSCGPDLCRVRCAVNGSSVLDIDSVWFTSRTKPGYLQSSVTAMYQLPFFPDHDSAGRNLGGFFFAVAGDEFHCSQLDTDIRWAAHDMPSLPHDNGGAVPRKLLTGAKPTSITYLKPIRKMLVATMEAKEVKSPPNGYRVLHSTLKLLDVHGHKNYDELEVKQEGSNEYASRLVAAQYELKHGERVYSVTEWPFTDHRNKTYTLIIVGTGVPKNNGKEAGRRLIFNVGRNESNAKLQLKKESTFDHPVYCTAVYSNKASVSAVGKTLTFDMFESEAGLLQKRATIDLPSPCIHITIRAGHIYVSTLQHSHLCFVVFETLGQYDFRRIFTDSRERACSTHLVVDIDDPSTNTAPKDHSTIVLVNDKKSSSITGLFHTPQRMQKNAAPTVFEACLPRTIIRLQQGDVRPPWRRPATSPHAPTGVLNDEIIGACSDGTIYTLSILSKPARLILRLLQNLIEEKDKRDPANLDTPVNLHQRSGGITDILMNGAEGNQDDKIRALDVDPRQRERGVGGARHKHVDGDLIQRWLAVDGDIEKLVTEGTEENVGKLFREFVQELWGTNGGVVKKVEVWLGEVFMPVL